MLQNPDIAPSTSINRWIVSILTFHFKLVHVPRVKHGPDGLSHHPPQPDDPLQDEDSEFDDWIDRLHSFVHFINPVAYLESPSNLVVFAQNLVEEADEQSDADSDEEQDSDAAHLAYADFPRTDSTRRLDQRLALIPDWFETLTRPDEIVEDKYISFVKYATQFFAKRDSRPSMPATIV
ncbi:hypothetical protein NEOLEDRAFT_1179691 [Neolentinus lepideus HHB14362 ss-1]|uniref:Uncharacterized protein n=1 Tax=Neolentinus lepideus HHB14362 ss-1 TaxID=1314782 RepID=A0A165RKG1_9AGAM|nr:hypothetical protein NEOLEDRAFT_1179691 [Neolentinus lepideus HHB14362 ss-1]